MDGRTLADFIYNLTLDEDCINKIKTAVTSSQLKSTFLKCLIVSKFGDEFYKKVIS